ncbi:MAG: hypothetical protein BGO43_07845 [Gammaproteobacteria bacterium 39-13]|nr:hypothetical protein [Gammaproteobacteria bacterium]OJV93080.1 MAG: hypothetical protein BGO43_07845 [Gammaproteobacteria bacterium 39-13]
MLNLYTKKEIDPKNITSTPPPSSTSSLSPQDLQFLPGYCYKRAPGKLTLTAPFFNEAIAESVEEHHYLNSVQREVYRITCKDGFLYNSKGQLLHGPILYVLFPDGRLYGCPVTDGKHHSHISSGLLVKGAGILYCESGQMITLSNESGHYKPELEEMQEAIDWFANTLRREFIFEDHSHQNNMQEFDGIAYYKVKTEKHDQTTVLQAIGFDRLVVELAAMRAAALQCIDKTRVKVSVTLEELMGCSDVYYGEPSKPTIIDYTLPLNIMNYPDLLSYTCLQNLTIPDKRLSRFNGILRIAK